MDVLDGRTDGRKGGQTDGHNCSDTISSRHDHELNPSKIIFPDFNFSGTQLGANFSKSFTWENTCF